MSPELKSCFTDCVFLLHEWVEIIFIRKKISEAGQEVERTISKAFSICPKCSRAGRYASSPAFQSLASPSQAFAMKGRVASCKPCLLSAMLPVRPLPLTSQTPLPFLISAPISPCSFQHYEGKLWGSVLRSPFQLIDNEFLSWETPGLFPDHKFRTVQPNLRRPSTLDRHALLEARDHCHTLESPPMECGSLPREWEEIMFSEKKSLSIFMKET